MKLTIIISLILTTYLSAATQIVIGTFSKSSSAVNTKDQLNKTIDNNTELKSLIETHNIKSVTKQDGKYFVVTLEPLLDKSIEKKLLSLVRQTKYKDAYILKLDMPKVEIPKEIETKEEDIKSLNVPKKIKPDEKKVEPQKVIPQEITPVVVKEKPVKKAPQEPVKKPVEKTKESFVEKFMIEIIAFIAILILIVVYIVILKNRQKKHLEDEQDIVIIDHNQEDSKDFEQDSYDEYDTKDQTPQDEQTPAVPDSESISFNEDFEQDSKEEEEEVQEQTQANIDPLRSAVEKKEIPDHGKISKEDFKEFEGMRVMIAEDNLINQKVIKGLLSESGIQLTIVDDGEEVIKHLEKDDAFCIILMDVNMPNMDGFEATKIIRANPKYSHITVIALSGDVAADDIANMRAAGMQENLEKPLKMDALYDILYGYGYHREDKIELETYSQTGSTGVELDAQTGIEVCGGDEDFYKEILRDFIDSYEGSTKTIQDFLNNNERKAAQQILLDITGITANIGAINLQHTLQSLKQELKDPEGKEYIETFKKYAQQFEALEAEVKEYLS